MTWIVGTSTPFGYAGLIADTRVSWSNGVHADILQKIHPVGRNLMVGFAGSVTLGFRALRHLKRLADEDHDSRGSNPVPLLVRWQGVLQSMVEGDPAHAKDGCQLIAAGLTQHNGELLSACFTMVAPHFEVTSSPPGQWNSIGSGSDYDHARLLLGKRFHEFANNLMQGEVAERSRGPGGYLRAVGFALAHSLFQDPQTDVSDLLQVGLVTANGCILQPQQITFNVGTDLERKRATPADLCTSLEMLEGMAGQLGVDAGAATAHIPFCGKAS